MDNICHTLVGAVCGEAGLKHRSRFGNATLMIAANLPDVDVAVFATGVPSVAFRRGITHGIAAQALLPPLLAAAVWLLARRRAQPGQPPARFGWLVVLAYVGVLSHVALDFLNTYGIRLLMPFAGRWFYGDTLFIVDPWLWLVLGVGVWRARHAGSSRPARAALLVAAVYVAVMMVAAQASRQSVAAAWESMRGSPPLALMVGPRPVTPFARDVIVDAGDHYATGTFTWFPAAVAFSAETVPKHDRDPLVQQVRQAPDVRGFLVWSRFPFWTMTPEREGTRVDVADMRFAAASRVLRAARFGASALVEH